MARVTVITPTYKRPQILAEYLRAVAAQTYRDFSIVLINDGGPSVAEVVAACPQAPVTLIELTTNGGHAAARNVALAQADSELIALCDDDDLWLPEHLQRLVAHLDATQADLVYADSDLVQMTATPSGRQQGQRRRFAFDPNAALLRRWNTIISSACLYRRVWHDRLGRFDVTLADYWDWDWFLSLTAASAQFARMPACTALVAVPTDGAQASAVPDRMAPNLQKLVQKHGLDPLPSSNFWRMLDEPELQPHICHA